MFEQAHIHTHTHKHAGTQAGRQAENLIEATNPNASDVVHSQGKPYKAVL